MTGPMGYMRRLLKESYNFIILGVTAAALSASPAAGADPASGEAPQLAQATPSTAQTAGSVIGVLGAIQGLGGLAVTDVQAGQDVTTASVTVKGISAQLVGFSINELGYAAVLPGAFNFADFVPGIDGTALDEIALPSAVLIVAPAGSGSAQLSSDSLPKAVGDALAASGATSPTVTGGITLFGRIDGCDGGPTGHLVHDQQQCLYFTGSAWQRPATADTGESRW